MRIAIAATLVAFVSSVGAADASGWRVEPDGSIDGVSFAGDDFANVDALKAGPDLQARRATLDYLLTPGRLLSVGLRGCGAAGRIQKLVSAVELP